MMSVFRVFNSVLIICEEIRMGGGELFCVKCPAESALSIPTPFNERPLYSLPSEFVYLVNNFSFFPTYLFRLAVALAAKVSFPI